MINCLFNFCQLVNNLFKNSLPQKLINYLRQLQLAINNNNKQVSIPLRQIITSKKWLHQSSSTIISVNKINTSLSLVDTNKDKKHAKHQNSKCKNTVYTKERKQNIKK